MAKFPLLCAHLELSFMLYDQADTFVLSPLAFRVTSEEHHASCWLQMAGRLQVHLQAGLGQRPKREEEEVNWLGLLVSPVPPPAVIHPRWCALFFCPQAENGDEKELSPTTNEKEVELPNNIVVVDDMESREQTRREKSCSD